jgi:hypothetical protein
MRAGLRFGALACLAGAVLGPVRKLLLAPRLGGMAAAPAEAAMLALLLWLAARATLPAGFGPRDRLAMAATALALVLLVELVLGLAFAASGLAQRRVPRGAAEQLPGLALLGWLAALPFLVRR